MGFTQATARVANLKSSVANDETGFKVVTLKDLLQSSKVNRQPIGKRETKFKKWKEIRIGSQLPRMDVKGAEAVETG
jgi:DUF1009 family protein